MPNFDTDLPLFKFLEKNFGGEGVVGSRSCLSSTPLLLAQCEEDLKTIQDHLSSSGLAGKRMDEAGLSVSRWVSVPAHPRASFQCHAFDVILSHKRAFHASFNVQESEVKVWERNQCSVLAKVDSLKRRAPWMLRLQQANTEAQRLTSLHAYALLKQRIDEIETAEVPSPRPIRSMLRVGCTTSSYIAVLSRVRL